ncbi:MAG: serine hydrolase [Candidatus Saccharimonas sp.]
MRKLANTKRRQTHHRTDTNRHLPSVRLHDANRHRQSDQTSTKGVKRWLAVFTRKQFVLWVSVGLFALLMIVQVLYPPDRLLMFSSIDGIALSWQKKDAAAEQLNAAYAGHAVDIYMTGDKKPVTTPKLSELDVTIDNAVRVDQLDYPWYLRIIPTSFFWAGLRDVDEPTPTFGSKFQSYVDQKLMSNCRQAPINATLKADGDKLVTVTDKDGRSCEKDDVVASIKKIRPILTTETSVRVGAKIQPADVTKSEATVVAQQVNERIGNGIVLDAKGNDVTIPAADIVGWLDFAPHDDTVDVTVSVARAGDWFAKNVADKMTVPAGVSYITTRDFTETSRVNGLSGQALDTPATVSSIQQVILGDAQRASASTKVVPPSEKYTRTYSPSDQGLSALLANYAKDHTGTFGISMIELDGKKRRADYNGGKQFVTASTYKLFVAYSLMKRIDAGQRDWNTEANCFNKMISNSDNTCAESFLNSLGLSNVTKDIQAIGLTNSTFMKSGGPFTTANDLTLLLGMIATGQNFSSVNQQRLIAAMKVNVYRNGIPAGASGQVADKVGFLNGLLHDAAIVYGPSGTYVLAIMTEGSSWATIADLTRQIDTLRAQ